MVLFSSNKSGGNGGLEMYAHPKGFQTRGQFSWDSSSYKDGYKYIFKQAVLLPNGNNWFDVGRDEEEAMETCAFMLEGLKKQYPTFVNNFRDYPEGLLEITPEDFPDKYLTVYRKFSLSFYGETSYDAAIWLSKFHNFYGSPHFEEFAELARQIMVDACAEKGVAVNPRHDEYIDNLKKAWPSDNP